MDLDPQLSDEQLRNAAAIATPAQFRWLRGIVSVVIVLNAVDAVLTLYWLQTRRATEGNAFLAEVATRFPIHFVVAKLLLVSLGSLLLWRLRTNRLAVIGMFLAFLAYYYLLLVHIRGMNIHLLARLLTP